MGHQENNLWQHVINAIDIAGPPHPADGALIVRNHAMIYVAQATVTPTDGYIYQLPAARIANGDYLRDQQAILDPIRRLTERGLF